MLPSADHITARGYDIYDADRRGTIHGRALCAKTGVLSGTLSVIMQRLVNDGLVDFRWEKVDEIEAGRPRRKYYRLNDSGAKWARLNLAVGKPAATEVLRRLVERRMDGSAQAAEPV